jgi:hypothetical protein
MITFTGQAIDGAPGRGATEALRAGVTVDEKKQAIEEIPVTFGWTMREIEQAAARNVPLDRWTIQSAMTAVARKIDHRLAFGVAGTTMTGLLNHASTQASTATTKTGGQIEWTAATPGTEMLADINKLVADLHSSLLQASLLPGGESIPAFERVTVLMPTFHYGLAMETPRTTTSDTTVLDYALAHNKWIESIEEWNACDIASAVGGTPGTTGAAMMFAYAKDPLAVGALIPNDWKQRAPQEKGHNIEIPAVGLCGGTVIRYAMATRKMNLTD